MSDAKKVEDWLTFYAPRKQQEGERSAQEAADGWGVTWTTARRKLEALVKEGGLERIDGVVLNTGKLGTVYRPKK